MTCQICGGDLIEITCITESRVHLKCIRCNAGHDGGPITMANGIDKAEIELRQPPRTVVTHASKN